MKKDFSINDIVMNITKDIIPHQEINLDSSLIGPDNMIESIDIVQIISGIEDRLEEIGFPGIDLFEDIFEKDKMNFKDLINLIEDKVKT